MMDCSGDDLISKQEFFKFLSIMGMDGATINGLWTSIDIITDDDVIDDIELAQSASLKRLLTSPNEKVEKLVGMIDKNGDGTITVTEMRDFLMDKCGLREDHAGVAERLGEIDSNDDGTISMKELKRCKVLTDLMVSSGLAAVRIDGLSAAMRSSSANSTSRPLSKPQPSPSPPPPSLPPPQQVDIDDSDCDLAIWACNRTADYRTADGPSGDLTDSVGTRRGVVALAAGLDGSSDDPTDTVGTGKGVVAFTAGFVAISLAVLVIR